MAKKLLLKKELFIAIGGEPDDQYYDVNQSPETHAVMGEAVEVGRYRLVEVLAVVGVPKITVNKKS